MVVSLGVGFQCALPGKWRSGQCRTMTNDARLEIRLPTQHRLKLDRLAEETGLTVGTLMRLAAMRLVHDGRRTLLELVGKDLEAA